MKKKIALLALALTLCGAFAAFPVSALEAGANTETGTVMTESVKTEEKVIYLSESNLNVWFSLRQYVDRVQKTMEFTTDSTFASIRYHSIRIDKSILDQEQYNDIPEVIVECKLGAYNGLPEKRMTLRFIFMRCTSAGTDTDRNDISEEIDDRSNIVSRDKGRYFSISSLNELKISKNVSFVGVSGVEVGTTVSNSSIATPITPVENRRIYPEPTLSNRYNNEPDMSMAVRLPFLNSEPRKISVDLGNENVTNLIGGNTLNRSSFITAPESNFCYYTFCPENPDFLIEGNTKLYFDIAIAN